MQPLSILKHSCCWSRCYPHRTYYCHLPQIIALELNANHRALMDRGTPRNGRWLWGVLLATGLTHFPTPFMRYPEHSSQPSTCLDKPIAVADRSYCTYDIDTGQNIDSNHISFIVKIALCFRLSLKPQDKSNELRPSFPRLSWSTIISFFVPMCYHLADVRHI